MSIAQWIRHVLKQETPPTPVETAIPPSVASPVPSAPVDAPPASRRRFDGHIPEAATGPGQQAAAYRLIHELEGLIRGVSADHVIVPDETARLSRWLIEADAYRHIEPFRGLAQHVDRVLVDGVLTLDECEDLLFVTSNLTTVNPHFDQLRGGLQQLMGMLAGVSSDGKIHAHEVQRLSSWSDEWSHLKGLWPFDECEALVTSMLTAKTWTDQPQRLLALARQFPVAGELDAATGELPPTLIGGICSVNPDIAFEQRTFVFTGESDRCERAEMQAMVRARQGLADHNVTKRTHYLVVCPGGSPYWAFACYGRKVEYAYKLRQKGHGLQIVHEVDFWDAVVP